MTKVVKSEFEQRNVPPMLFGCTFLHGGIISKVTRIAKYEWPDFWSVQRLQPIIYNSSIKNVCCEILGVQHEIMTDSENILLLRNR